MTAHADREHATWSASAAKRNFACAGALALTMNLPDTTSAAADWGTCAHQIAEHCLRDNLDADRFLGMKVTGKKFSFEVDEEMVDCAQVYVDYVRERFAAANPSDSADPADWGALAIEQRFSLARLNPPFDAGGTADAVIYLPAEKRLVVVDLKGGRGVVVEAKDNPQGRTYALGAMLAFSGYDVDTVEVVIVQPRAPHKDGRIRSDVFHVADLIDWSAAMLVAMQRAKNALDAHSQITGPLTEAEWSNAWLSPGGHCRDTFCGAAGFCPALRLRAEAAVGLHFDPITDEPKLANAPDSGSPEERAKRLDTLDLVEDWIKQVRAYEHRMAEMGQPAPGYGLVEKIGREKFVSGDAEATAIAAARAAGVPEGSIMNAPKARTPKQIKDAMKKAKADLSVLDGLSAAESSGTNLVRLDGSIRPAKSPVDLHLTAIQQE